jgi:hypothetical protein
VQEKLKQRREGPIDDENRLIFVDDKKKNMTRPKLKLDLIMI